MHVRERHEQQRRARLYERDRVLFAVDVRGRSGAVDGGGDGERAGGDECIA